MKFSIILPVKNGGSYVKECVSSILAQTYPGFNLHILENCSTDGTAEWLNTLKDERVIIYPAEKPLTIEENWGRMISIPRNEFMTMIGHDDVLDNNYLEVMNGLIEKYPDASLYQTHFRYIDGKGRFLKKCKRMAERQSAGEFLAALLNASIDTMGTGYMMKSRYYETIGGIKAYPNLLFADHELWIKLTFIHFKVTNGSECFSYRLHENISKHTDAVRYINAFYRFMEFLVEMKSKTSEVNFVIEKNSLNYLQYHCRSLAHRLLRTPENKRDGMTVSGFINRCQHYAKYLVPGENFPPNRQIEIGVAKAIDNNIITRKLYVFFRRFYTKPIFTSLS